MKRSIAIIDHVGSKAGMDYYSSLLAESLVKYTGHCLLISNFTIDKTGVKSYRYFAGHLKSPLLKSINHFLGFLRAAVCCRINGCSEAIVHTFSFAPKDVYSFAVLRFFGIRITAIVHDVEGFSANKLHRFSRLMLHKQVAKIVVHNKFSYDQLLQINGSELQYKTRIIPHGHYHSLPSAITKDQAREKLGLDDDKDYLLFFGQIKEVKGLEILLRAMPLLPEDIHLVIAGKPWKSSFAEYDKIIEQSGIGHRIVKMIRFIEDNERDILFKACDILILPYKQIFQSGVMLMAMSYKIPVIASDLVPNKEVIKENETGLLFRSEDTEDLAATIKVAISRQHQLQEMALHAWEQLQKRNDWDKIAKALLD